MEVYVCLEGLLVWFILGGWDVNGSLVLVYLRQVNVDCGWGGVGNVWL